MEEFKYGLYFPIVLDQGKPVPPGLADSIDASLRNILTFPYNVRNFTPTFGALVHLLLGNPLSDSTVSSVKVYTRIAINRWEKRIEIKEIVVDRDNDNGTLFLTVDAVIKNLGVNYTFQVHL